MPRHDLDAFSLVAGVLAAGLGVVALFDRGGLAPRWVVPVLLIAVGVAGLVATAAGGPAGRRGGRTGGGERPGPGDSQGEDGGGPGRSDPSVHPQDVSDRTAT